MKPFRYIVATLLALSLGLPALALPRIVPGDEAADRTQSLIHEINWLTDLNQAESQARSQGKMIFWIQMLGQMSGAT